MRMFINQRLRLTTFTYVLICLCFAYPVRAVDPVVATKLGLSLTLIATEIIYDKYFAFDPSTREFEIMHEKMDQILENTDNLGKQIKLLSDHTNDLKEKIDSLPEKKILRESLRILNELSSHTRMLNYRVEKNIPIPQRIFRTHERLADEVRKLVFEFVPQSIGNNYTSDIYMLTAFYSVSWALHTQLLADMLIADQDYEASNRVSLIWYNELIDQLEKDSNRLIRNSESLIQKESKDYQELHNLILSTTTGRKISDLLTTESKIRQEITLCFDGEPYMQDTDNSNSLWWVSFGTTVSSGLVCLGAAAGDVTLFLFMPVLTSLSCPAVAAGVYGMEASKALKEAEWERVVFNVTLADHTVTDANQIIASIDPQPKDEWWVGQVRKESAELTPEKNLSCQTVKDPREGNKHELSQVIDSLGDANLHAQRVQEMYDKRKLIEKAREILQSLRQRAFKLMS